MESQLSMGDQFLTRVKQIIKDNIGNEDFTVAILAVKVGLSRSMLHRKLIRLTNKSATELITEIRLQKALQLLENDVATVSEIAYKVGFASPSYFNKVFKKHYGIPPGDIRNKRSTKANPTSNSKAKVLSGRAKSWRIASLISIGIILGLIVLNIIQRTAQKEILDKSIAVLPFVSLSDDPEKQYLADGVMLEILLHLSKIEALRVSSRTSVEQYRDSEKTATEICQELDVAFLLEGDFRIYGDQARLVVRLVQPGKEDNIWSQEYDREWKEIFSVENRVAQAIAKELQVVITPEEQQLIEKIPTTNLMAYELYKKGREEFLQYQLDEARMESLERAEDLFEAALILDSTYAQVYTKLAYIQWYKHIDDTYYSEAFVDSAFKLANKALDYDTLVSEAYTLKGSYYNEKGEPQKALEQYMIALELNPNDWQAYSGLGIYYLSYDLVKSVENIHHALSLHRGPFYPLLLRDMSIALAFAGFTEKAIEYITEATDLNGDSISFYTGTSWIYGIEGEFEKALECAKRCYALDSTNTSIHDNLGWTYLRLGKKDESLKFYQSWYEGASKSSERDFNITLFRMALAYWENGLFEEAEYYFDQQIHFNQKESELGRLKDQLLYNYLALAAIQAFRGEKEKALENLKIFSAKKSMPIFDPAYIEHEPFFDKVKDDPEFQAIFQEIEAKYQACHERVGQWLEENDLL